MPASTAPAAKAAILALLAARPALAAVSTGWGGPTEEEDVTQDMIWLGDTEVAGQWRTLGAGNRHESYTIGLTVAVRRYGDDEQTTEEYAWDLLDEVSAALFADKTLGGLLEGSAIQIENARQRNQPAGPQQWGSRIDALIRCNAKFIP